MSFYVGQVANLRPIVNRPAREPDNREAFEAGIETALQRILASPKFVFRVERDPSRSPASPSHHRC